MSAGNTTKPPRTVWVLVYASGGVAAFTYPPSDVGSSMENVHRYVLAPPTTKRKRGHWVIQEMRRGKWETLERVYTSRAAAEMVAEDSWHESRVVPAPTTKKRKKRT